MSVPLIGLGTTKFGRQQGLKNASPFALPSDLELQLLLDTACDLGIDLLDTAPAYGNSEERIGKLISGARKNWLLVSKVGEEFEHGRSRFDFSALHTKRSVERSLRRLQTDYLDIILLHSSGDNEVELLHSGAMKALRQMKETGQVRGIGISHKTTAGGLAAVTRCDVIMTPYSRAMSTVVEAAQKAGCGVLLKKVLNSGQLATKPGDLSKALTGAATMPGVSSLILGTTNPQHLAENAGVLAKLPL